MLVPQFWHLELQWGFPLLATAAARTPVSLLQRYLEGWCKRPIAMPAHACAEPPNGFCLFRGELERREVVLPAGSMVALGDGACVRSKLTAALRQLRGPPEIGLINEACF